MVAYVFPLVLGSAILPRRPNKVFFVTDKVYYNSACPVCNAGIRRQRRRMEACGITDIEWIDVHTHPERVIEVGAPLEKVRERLYVKDGEGRLHVGADAGIHLGARTKGMRGVARAFGLPGLRQLARLGYNGFAWCLYRWNRARRHW